jgi:hypothetical protein
MGVLANPAGNACLKTVILREMTLDQFKVILERLAKEFLMVTSATLIRIVTLRNSVYLTNNGLLSLLVLNLEPLMKAALTTLNAQSLTTAGTLPKRMLQNKKTHVNLPANVCLNSHRIMKRNLDGSTLLVILTYKI